MHEPGISITGQDRVNLQKTKRCFLLLCKQYKHIGQLYQLFAKTLSHPIFADSSGPQILNRIIEQYTEMGEQMKIMGDGLDSLGGEPVLQPKEKKISFPKPKIKPSIHKKAKEETETKNISNTETYISNVVDPEGEKIEGSSGRN